MEGEAKLFFMKPKIINMMILLMAVCIATSSKETNHSMTKSCSAICAEENAGTKTVVAEEQQQEAILSPVNLFMIHIQ